ncbi:hypothetical protein MATR_15340 [Marivirga tractuosa]|uniref:DUF6970 domain-containing protein n=1 Tax=Marivirga tractuosa (strain ATCC 23168 / DSM 4126 / NBRC 15989 / NCIMB 1408 / VKM B-1430 / H-43) TaxID=643867 RepID=E4TSM0_MARTH|nr:hypothetical protein [Marivirga tractuosa]ADR20840.1 hypothetical protein Ftrac_0838 [Marivirga tractuosa DSM 4126]BDD14709.1 hypothetical protein MATR_15340 [Marivirga tractuosa]
MKKLSILLILVTLTIVSCKEEKLEPSCLNDKKSELKESSCEDGVQISLYKFQGSNVYLLEKGSCIADGSIEVIDSKCNRLGFLGGLAGSDEIDGVKFYENSSFVEVVWEK